MRTQSAIKILTEAKEVLVEMKTESIVDERIAALGVAVTVIEESIRSLRDESNGPDAGEDGGVR